MVSFCVAALADWDIIIGEPLLCHLNTKIDVAKQTMTIQPSTTQSPWTIKGTVRPFKNRQDDSNKTISSARSTVKFHTKIPPQLTSFQTTMDNKAELKLTINNDSDYSHENAIKQLGYDPFKLFPKVFPPSKPTKLPPLQKINHHINIIDKDKHLHMRPRCIRPTEKFLDQLRDKITQEIQAEQVYPAQDSSACSIFMVKKYDKPNEARF